MGYFYLLELWHSIEECRLKNGQKFANFLKKIYDNFFNNFKNFCFAKNSQKFFGFFAIILSLVWRWIFLHDQTNFRFINYSANFSNEFSPLVVILNYLEKVVENNSFNHFLLAEIIYIGCGVFLMYIVSRNLTNSALSSNVFSKNLLFFSLIFCYFFGFNLTLFSFELFYLKFLVIIYITLSLRENVKTNFFVNLTAILSFILMVISKWQLFFLFFAHEFLKLFCLKRELIKYSFDSNKLMAVKLRYFLNLTARILITLTILVVLVLHQKIFSINDVINQIKTFDFENYKFFSSQILNKLYRENNSLGFYVILSREILLIFWLIIIFKITKKKYLNSSLSSADIIILDKFFDSFFVASFAMILIVGYDDKILKLLFLTINFSLVFFIFIASIINQNFNFRKYGIVLLLLISIALGDYKVFFEIFFYLPFSWFIIHLILLRKLSKKISSNDLKNLNLIENFYFLKKIHYKIFFGLIVVTLIYCQFYFSFFVAWFISVGFFSWQLVFFNKINQKFLKNDHFHFLLTIVVVMTFVYYTILSLNFFELSNYNFHSEFTKQKKYLNSYLVNKINSNARQDDVIIIIDNQQLLDAKLLEKNNNISPKNIILINNFKNSDILSKITNKKNKIFIINNSFIFNNKSCLISNFEELSRIAEFKTFFRKNLNFSGSFKLAYSSLKNYNFYNNKTDNSNIEENYLIYDFHILLRK